MNNLTNEQIEFMAKCHEAITNKIDIDKPFPQYIEVVLPVNFITNKPRSSGVIVNHE